MTNLPEPPIHSLLIATLENEIAETALNPEYGILRPGLRRAISIIHHLQADALRQDIQTAKRESHLASPSFNDPKEAIAWLKAQSEQPPNIVSGDEAVERVAKALFYATGHAFQGEWECTTKPVQNHWIKKAKAAIEAMGGVYGVGRSSDLKPEAMGAPVSDKDDNLAPSANMGDAPTRKDEEASHLKGDGFTTSPASNQLSAPEPQDGGSGYWGQFVCPKCIQPVLMHQNAKCCAACLKPSEYSETPCVIDLTKPGKPPKAIPYQNEDTATGEVISSEIPVVAIDLTRLIGDSLSAWLDNMGITISGQYNEESDSRWFLAQNIAQVVRPHIRTTEPVRKCDHAKTFHHTYLTNAQLDDMHERMNHEVSREEICKIADLLETRHLLITQRPTVPVMVDLEAGARAISEAQAPDGNGNRPGWRYCMIDAKACAEAWGLKWK